MRPYLLHLLDLHVFLAVDRIAILVCHSCSFGDELLLGSSASIDVSVECVFAALVTTAVDIHVGEG